MPFKPELKQAPTQLLQASCYVAVPDGRLLQQHYLAQLKHTDSHPSCSSQQRHHHAAVSSKPISKQMTMRGSMAASHIRHTYLQRCHFTIYLPSSHSPHAPLQGKPVCARHMQRISAHSCNDTAILAALAWQPWSDS